MSVKKSIIKNIVKNNPRIKEKALINLSEESLLIIQIQTELELLNTENKKR